MKDSGSDRLLRVEKTRHASMRAAQRNIGIFDMDFVLTYGKRTHSAGALFIFLRKRDIPDEFRTDDRVTKLEGTTLVISTDDNSLITLYKNKGGFRKLRKKSKRNMYH